jgi:arsenate reductase-like glutaredoxin family protein
MLNENASNLKAHLKTLRQDLAETGEVDEELQELLRQLDRDIKQLLDKREEEADTDTFGLAERTQELSARFAVEHPRLEPTLRELGRILANMGI